MILESFWHIFCYLIKLYMKKKTLTGSQMDSSKTAMKTCVMCTPESILLLGWIDILNVRERSMNRREVAEIRQILISPVYVLPAQLAPMYSRYLETNMDIEFLFLRISVRFFLLTFLMWVAMINRGSLIQKRNCVHLSGQWQLV